MKIEKGIPIPENRGTKGVSAIARQMEVGDSVLCSTHEEAKSLLTALHNVCKDTPYRGSSRKVDDGWRVWKIKREE